MIAVATGEGMRDIFYQEFNAAHVIAGGQTMNPSADDFLKAMEPLPNTEIVLLPNNKNVVMAAQQAANLVGNKQVRVIPTTTMPQGIGAMLAYANTREHGRLDEIEQAMQEAITQIVTCEITTAIRDSNLNGMTVHQGQYLGLLDGDMIVVGDTEETVARDLLRQAITEWHELVTLYYGSEIEESQAQHLVDRLSTDFSDQEFQLVYGGQPLYPYIFSVE